LRASPSPELSNPRDTSITALAEHARGRRLAHRSLSLDLLRVMVFFRLIGTRNPCMAISVDYRRQASGNRTHAYDLLTISHTRLDGPPQMA